MDDHDLLIRIDERLCKSTERMKRIEAVLEKFEARCMDSDERIDRIEGWKNKVTGALALMGVFVTSVAVFVFKLFGGK